MSAFPDGESLAAEEGIAMRGLGVGLCAGEMNMSVTCFGWVIGVREQEGGGGARTTDLPEALGEENGEMLVAAWSEEGGGRGEV